MKRVYVYCEGQTEEAFVNSVLNDYFKTKNIFLYPIVAGGVSSYERFSRELVRLCRQFPNDTLTTMIDFYALPKNFPGMESTEEDVYKKIALIEDLVEKRLDKPNLMFYISLHEFESLLFSDTSCFDMIDKSSAKKLTKIKAEFGNNPELINSSLLTAPSKRIYRCIPFYSKIINGMMLSKAIGIERMKSECKHFSEWIEKIWKM